MAKKTQIRPMPVPTSATVRRDGTGGVVTVALVFQPEDAAKLTDALVNALIRNGRER